jgi:hypothetical protein
MEIPLVLSPNGPQVNVTAGQVTVPALDLPNNFCSM